MRVLRAQHAIKRRLKPLLFAGGRRPRTVKWGPARGVRLLLDRRINLQIELGLWETELVPFYRELIRPGCLAYDVGAADGYTALLYAALGARVVAFEPAPDAVALLRQNLDLNPSLRDRLEIVADVYRERAGELPDFVKVDVDGAEVEVLESTPRAPAIVIETHSPGLERRCLELLAGRGYRTEIVPNARWRRLYPEYRPLEHNRWLVARL